MFHQVTGRILNSLWKKPSSLDISDVEAYSILESPARCPKFHYRYPVHPDSGLQHDSVLLLRVYTLDVDTGEMVVVGNCALDLYKQQEPEQVTMKKRLFLVLLNFLSTLPIWIGVMDKHHNECFDDI